MTEYQLISNFNLFLISNAMFQLGVFVLLWAALRGSLRIYDQGANIATKIISSLFGVRILFCQLAKYFLCIKPTWKHIFICAKICWFLTSDISTWIHFNSLESDTRSLVGSCCDCSSSANLDKEIKIIKI